MRWVGQLVHMDDVRTAYIILWLLLLSTFISLEWCLYIRFFDQLAVFAEVFHSFLQLLQRYAGIIALK
jgi:hypothetical protein